MWWWCLRNECASITRPTAHGSRDNKASSSSSRGPRYPWRGNVWPATTHRRDFFFFLLDGFSSLSLSAQFYRLLVMSRPPLISSSSSLLFPSFLFPDDFPSLSLHIARNTIESGDNKRPSHYYYFSLSLSLLHRER